jgi:hypothetical protein
MSQTIMEEPIATPRLMAIVTIKRRIEEFMKDYFGIRTHPPGLHAMPGRIGWNQRIGKRRADTAKTCE